MSSIITQNFRRNILPFQLVTRKVLLSQSQKFVIRNSNPVLFQLSLSKSCKNSIFPPPFPQEDSITVKRLPAVIIAKLVVSVIFSLIPVDIIYAWYINRCNENLLNKTIEEGTRPVAEISKNMLLSRPVIIKRLKEILQSNEDQSFYHVVCGEHGTGKTTLTRIASCEAGQDKDKCIQGGMGIIYIDIPSDFENLGEAFGKAINFAFEKNISITEQLGRKILGITKDKPEISKWKRAFKAFKHASAVYKVKHGKPPIIIYDNVNRLIHKNPELLDILQDDAKDNADDRNYIAIFVSSESSVLKRMESRSAWSRADKPVIEIGDLSKKESKDYLIKRCTFEKREGDEVIKDCKITDEQVNELYELVGGRIVNLKSVVEKFLAGQSLKVIKKSILDEVEKKLKIAQLHEKQLYYEVGKKVIKALLKSKELEFITFMKFFDNYEDADKVLEANIFAYHPEKNTVSFQSQSVECYIQEKKDIFIN